MRHNSVPEVFQRTVKEALERTNSTKPRIRIHTKAGYEQGRKQYAVGTIGIQEDGDIVIETGRCHGPTDDRIVDPV